MMKYLVTIKDEEGTEFTGEFEGLDETFAGSEAQLFYAYELDCEPQNIEIIDIKISEGK